MCAKDEYRACHETDFNKKIDFFNPAKYSLEYRFVQYAK